MVIRAETPHKFSTGPGGYEAVHIHASPRFVTDWLGAGAVQRRM
jgi:hypothetical protein